jgi:hypothetical protein
MVETDDGPGFPGEALKRIRVVEVPCLDGFDRYELPAIAMFGEIHGRHAALSELSDELVAVLQCA